MEPLGEEKKGGRSLREKAASRGCEDQQGGRLGGRFLLIDCTMAGQCDAVMTRK